MLRRRAARDAADALTDLAESLVDPASNDVRGIALASCLLRNPASPLFTRGSGSIADSARTAIAALSGDRYEPPLWLLCLEAPGTRI